MQDDVNALLTAEMQADKERDATGNGSGTIEMPKLSGTAQEKKRRDELADDDGDDGDDEDLEDEGIGDM